jgi:hypothetical protein
MTTEIFFELTKRWIGRGRVLHSQFSRSKSETDGMAFNLVIEQKGISRARKNGFINKNSFDTGEYWNFQQKLAAG